MDRIWTFANIAVGACAIPNLIAVLALSGAFLALMRDYLQNRFPDIELLYQQSRTGEAEAIALAESFCDRAPVAVFYPDNVYLPGPGALRQLNEAYQRYQTDLVALSMVDDGNQHAFSNAGRVDLTPLDDHVFQIRRFIPKTRDPFQRRYAREWRACGMLITGLHLFAAIHATRPRTVAGEFSDQSVRQYLLQHHGLLGLALPGAVHDIGNPAGYRHCLSTLAGLDGGHIEPEGSPTAEPRR